ncbi:reverse transcriptase domain-containing protein [Tanacetum coccineum]
MHRDAQDMIRTCNDFQIHRPVPRHPQQTPTLITAPWPFYKWGIDIDGPFLEGPGIDTVAMDYFTKWIEAKTVATITGNQVKKFVWDNIVCRFGLPGEIVSDNDKQFSDNPFKDWCEKLNITQRFASVKYPQTNGLVERANRSLGEGIKARLGEGNKNWIEELPHVLWAHRTMIKSSHGDTPFSLAYGTEAVIPAEIGMPTYRITVVDAAHNDEELRLNLDLLEEQRDSATIWEAKAKSKMIKHYNARVRGVTFRPGDFVYRSNDASHAIDGGKLGPKSEGPYEVTEYTWKRIVHAKSHGWRGTDIKKRTKNEAKTDQEPNGMEKVEQDHVQKFFQKKKRREDHMGWTDCGGKYSKPVVSTSFTSLYRHTTHTAAALGLFVMSSQGQMCHAIDGGKLGPKSEGPYEVTEALRDGAYMLRAMDGAVLPRTWNIANLKKYYL